MPNDIITFGCRLNTYESEVMRGHLAESGAEDTVVFNSCAVTAAAERQLRSEIRKIRRERPASRIIVTGCAAQIDPQKYAAMPEVNLVMGNKEKLQKESFSENVSRETLEVSSLSHREKAGGEGDSDSQMAGASSPHPRVKPGAGPSPLPQGASVGEGIHGAISPFIIPNEEKIRVNDIMSVTETASHMVSAFEGRTRAFVQIQNGCNHRCTFCIIPFGRGNSRSVPAGEVVREIAGLVEQGYKEVVLTGVDISAYGEDLPGQPTLGNLCGRILKLVPDLPRLRLSSIDAVEVDDTLFRLIAEEARIMPHLHLSLQAGDNMILKRMKRRHSREDAIDFCAQVRESRPDMVFGADIIAGFPTETEEMFQNSLDIIEECGLTWLHVFPYSARTGTPAAKMPQLPGDVRKERAARLRAKGEVMVDALLSSRVGLVEQVLVEKDGAGHTEQYAPVMVDGDVEAGEIVEARVSGVHDNRLMVEKILALAA